MGRLLLVRHGESVWNRDAIVQGQAGPGLSPLGHEQADRVGAWLVDEVGDDVAFVSSDLVRCRETAAPFAERLGRQPTTDEALRERHFGAWQGLPRDEIAASDPDRWSRFARLEDVVEEVGGESTPTLLARVVPALRRLAGDAPETVVVTHGGPIWHGVHALLGLREPSLGPVGNASVTVIDIDPGQAIGGEARLIGWNAVGHVPRDRRSSQQRSRPRRVASDGVT